MTFIYHKDFNCLNLGDVSSIQKEYIVGQKKFVIFFFFANGARCSWTYDSAEDRDKAHDKILSVMQAVKI